jgi:hypothetical protein
MYLKKKHNDSPVTVYEESLIAKLQRRIGWTRTRKIEIHASSYQCLEWIKSWPEKNTRFNITVETQSLTLTYKFKAHIVTYGRYSVDKGVIIGSIAENQFSDSKSEITLHIYMLNYYISNIISMLLFIGLFIFSVFIALNLSVDTMPQICSTPILIVTSIVYIIMFIVTIFPFFVGGDEGLEIIRDYFSLLE